MDRLGKLKLGSNAATLTPSTFSNTQTEVSGAQNSAEKYECNWKNYYDRRKLDGHCLITEKA